MVGEGAGQAGGGEVVLDNGGAPVPGDVRQVAGRGHFPGGTDDKQQVALLGQFLGLLLDPGGNLFPEEDHVGLDEAAAGAEKGDLGEVQTPPGEGAPAFQADETVGVAVVFHHPAAPRGLVQVVHVLGNYPQELTLGLQLRQGVVGRVGPGPGERIVHFLDELPDFGGVFPKGRDVGVFHGVEAGPEAAFAAKVRDAAFHRDAGAGKGHGSPPLTNYCRQFLRANLIHWQSFTPLLGLGGRERGLITSTLILVG
jgi:hypothetical protein